MSDKRVAIIGSGTSGILSAKYAAENGLIPVVFEKRNCACGNWSTESGEARIWDGLNANLSKHQMAFSDHSFPKEVPIFAEKKDINDFLLSYIKKFKLEQYFRFNSKVLKVKQLENKKWHIEFIDTLKNETLTDVFDFLIVASGPHLAPYIPHFENQENFKGKIIHGSEFSPDDERFKSKRVLVIGCSHSGADMSALLVDRASYVMNMFRRPYILTRRFLRFKSKACKKNSFHILTFDQFINNRAFGKAPEHFSEEEKKDYLLKRLSLLNVEQTNKEKAIPALYYDLKNDFPRFAISDNYYEFAKQGKIVPKRSNIKRFETDSVVFEDGTTEKFDVILFATGYEVGLEYFDDSVKKILSSNSGDRKMHWLLYNSTFHPLIENMAMVYQNESIIGVSAELQCKWAAQVFSGKKDLPDKDLMFKELKRLEAVCALNIRNPLPFGNYVEIYDSLAADVESMHDFEEMKKTNPVKYRRLVNNLNLSCQFRYDSEEVQHIMNEIDQFYEKQYVFDDDDETENGSVRQIAEKFQEMNSVPVPIGLFRS